MATVDELKWYLSATGPRVTVTVRPDLTEVARAVALRVYDPDDPRGAARELAEIGREDVAWAIGSALDENAALSSPKKRERQLLLPQSVDARLVAQAKKRVRELYPEIEWVERAAERPLHEREHPAIQKILSNTYEGSGGGRPRVPENYPLMISALSGALLDLAGSDGRSSDPAVKTLAADAFECYRLCSKVEDTCRHLRDRGAKLATALRAEAGEERRGLFEAERIEAALADGELPYPNSQILPVGSYGMQPAYGLEPLVHQFAEDNLHAYDEIDRYGSVVMRWAERMAQRAREVLPPYVPDGED